MSVFLFSEALVVCIDVSAPILTDRGMRPHTIYRITDRIIQHLCALFIGVVVDSTALVYTVTCGGINGIDICADEDELPAALFLLLLYHFLDVRAGIDVAGIFISVRGDDEHGACGNILGAGVFMHGFDVLDRTADGIDKCGAAANRILDRKSVV